MPPRTTRSKATLGTENTKKAATSKKSPPSSKSTVVSVDESREPMMAYLRIRPHLGDQEPASSPYLSQLSDVSVRMVDPNHDVYNPSRLRPSTVPPTSTYTFSHVFPPDTTQSDFFRRTTLPLVNDVIQGQNSLLFAYGATNSGKTFTVQGGTNETTAGIVPRTLDVLFNSIDGLQGDGKFRPTRLYGVEPADPSEAATNFSKFNLPLSDPSIARVLGQDLEQVNAPEVTIDSTTLKTDRNYEYTVYISYAEVYNEKIFDLLASAKGSNSLNSSTSSLLLTRQALPLKPSPLSDSPGDISHNGKYVAGLSQFRVSSAAQAKAVVKFGQLQRRVFGTLANRESSRSHGIVIIKLMKVHRGERNDPTAVQVSRFTVVDLAGSERNKHTGTSGDRLREAGNINKSLMVLGQCLEVMRSNQRKLGMALGMTGTRVDTNDVKKALAVVPFRHSKLTELLMDYFIGDGRAVMIVNVNPYDTGYDENSHVMKFAALAREVLITPTPAPIQRIPQRIGLGKPRNPPATLKGDDIAPRPFSRKVTLSKTKDGKKLSETVLEVMEVDEDPQDKEDEDELEGSDALIEELFEEIASIRMQLFESEIRSAVIEAETREEVMKEMQERMRKMDEMYNQRLMDQMQANEMKMDAKINMLHRAGLFNQADPGDSDDEEDIEQSLMQEDQEGSDQEMSDVESVPSTPPAKAPPKKGRKSADSGVHLESSDIEEDAEEEEDGEDAPEDSDEESEYSGESEADEEEEDEYVPSPPPSAKKPRGKQPASKEKGKPQTQAPTSAKRGKRSTTGLSEKMSKLKMGEAKKRTSDAQEDQDMEEDDSDILQSRPPPKKRQLGKNKIVTEEEIMEETLETSNSGRPLRRRTQQK